MPLGRNRVLGDSSKNEAARPHRVAIANWPASIKDPRSQTLDALLNHLKAAGYDGVEMAASFFSRYFQNESLPVVAARARAALEKAGLRVFGATLHVGDDRMRKLHWIDGIRDEIKLVQDMGGEYASFQIGLHPDYLSTSGIYREDEEYLEECARNVAEMRQAAWELDMNFYVETHIDRITEDPQAFARILEMATCEVTGDLSHYLYRAFTKGKYVKAILARMGHTHVRMCRTHGDLSANVPDPKADWDAQGVTFQMFQFMKEGLAGGLSSRTIVGESGPMHLVTDTLTLDASLMPLYRAMAHYADNQALGIVQEVRTPQDLKPWG